MLLRTPNSGIVWDLISGPATTIPTQQKHFYDLYLEIRSVSSIGSFPCVCYEVFVRTAFTPQFFLSSRGCPLRELVVSPSVGANISRCALSLPWWFEFKIPEIH